MHNLVCIEQYIQYKRLYFVKKSMGLPVTGCTPDAVRTTIYANQHSNAYLKVEFKTRKLLSLMIVKIVAFVHKYSITLVALLHYAACHTLRELGLQETFLNVSSHVHF